MAKAIAEKPIFMCWGEGEENWGENPPKESIESTELAQAVGYRKASTVQFCEPTTEGDIVIPTGRFKISEAPTNHLHFKFNFDFEDAQGKTIQEIGVLVGTAIQDNMPEGQEYFEVDQIKDQGSLLLIEYRKPLYREVGARETFEFVVSF